MELKTEIQFFFGRYKGKTVAEVENYDYLKWFLNNVTGNKKPKRPLRKSYTDEKRTDI